jgi:hypothetical protein
VPISSPNIGPLSQGGKATAVGRRFAMHAQLLSDVCCSLGKRAQTRHLGQGRHTSPAAVIGVAAKVIS